MRRLSAWPTNDVDYCLQVLGNGLRVVVSPQAKLMHWGSATRGVTYDEAEHIAFVRKYRDFRDPHVSAALTLVDGSLQPLAHALRTHGTSRPPSPSADHP
jgi:GT2 family glycosyltransferase